MLKSKFSLVVAMTSGDGGDSGDAISVHGGPRVYSRRSRFYPWLSATKPRVTASGIVKAITLFGYRRSKLRTFLCKSSANNKRSRWVYIMQVAVSTNVELGLGL